MSINPVRISQRLMATGVISVGIAALSLACGSSGPPQISEQNRELCFRQAGGNYAAYARNAQEAAALVERRVADGHNIAAVQAAEYARQQADAAEDYVNGITDQTRRGRMDADDLRRAGGACRDIAEDYADYAERLAGQ